MEVRFVTSQDAEYPDVFVSPSLRSFLGEIGVLGAEYG